MVPTTNVRTNELLDTRHTCFSNAVKAMTFVSLHVAPSPLAIRKKTAPNTSTTSGRAAAALVTTVLLLGLTTNARADDESGGLLSWGQLQKEAGYFSKSGLWRGGLPKKERKEGDVWSNCLERHGNDSFCQKWEEKGDSAQEFRNGTCTCNEVKDSYCNQWTCISEEKARYCSERGRKGKGMAPVCKTDVEMLEDCSCHESLGTNTSSYCLKWRCTENDGNGTSRSGDYFCHETKTENSSTPFCNRWSGELTSNGDVESISCDCTIDDNGYCENWECSVRTLPRCSEHKGGWCHLELSIAVFGLIGLLFLIFGMVLVFSNQCSRHTSRDMQLKILIIYTLFLVLPWFAGVALSGGVIGIVVVIAMWIIPFIVLASAIIVPQTTAWQNFRAAMERMFTSEATSGNGEQTASPSDRTAPLMHGRPEDDADRDDTPQSSTQANPAIRVRDEATGKLLDP